jgi:hypothetical protein
LVLISDCLSFLASPVCLILQFQNI